MKIRKLHLKNIGVFDDEEIEFKECPVKDKAEIHILTGENGTGKTTILMALASLFDSQYVGSEFRINTKRNNFAKRLYAKSVFFFIVKHNGKMENIELLYKQGDYFESGKINQNLATYLNNYFEAGKEQFEDIITDFGAFAYSGYRRIKDDDIDLQFQVRENPLTQALDFIKEKESEDSYSTFTINNWLGRNLQKRSLANEENNKLEANRFAENIKNLEKVIVDIIGYEIRFKLKIDLTLVLIKDNQELDFDVLPDGLKSLISWIGDLLMRLDALKWKDDKPIFDREIILFLDEIEVHLHPAWQRKVLPIVQKLFKNAQIFVSTHSPFVVNSVDDAWVYKLKVDENGKAKVEEVIESENSNSITQVLREVFGIEQWFGLEVQNNFERFRELKRKIISNGADNVTENELLEKARSLADEPNDQLKQMIRKELEELSEIKKKPYKL